MRVRRACAIQVSIYAGLWAIYVLWHIISNHTLPPQNMMDEFYIAFFTSTTLWACNLALDARMPVQVNSVSVTQPVKPIQSKAIQNEPAKCSACLVRPITDTHYHLCATCKKTYIHEIQRVRTQKYRARQIGEPETLTVGEWIQTLKAFNFHCAHCQKAPIQAMDHFIPLGYGIGTTKENCVPSCYKCNGKKAHKHPEM